MCLGCHCLWVVIASRPCLLRVHTHTHTRTHTHTHIHACTHTHTHTHTPLSIYHLLLYLVSILYPQHRVHSSLSLSLFITPLSRVLDNMTPKILNASTYMLNHKNSFRIANLYTQPDILLTRIQCLPLVWGI